MLAAHRGDPGVVNMLLERGADIDARNNGGFTPLMFAARQGHDQVIEILLNRGANANIRNERRETAADLARAANHLKLADRLAGATSWRARLLKFE